MKKHKVIAAFTISLVLSIFLMQSSFAQTCTENKNVTCKTVKIKTSATTAENKGNIEKALNEIKGVEKADLDLQNQIVSITYNADKVSLSDFLKTIENKGFKAEQVNENSSKTSCCDKTPVKKSCCSK